MESGICAQHKDENIPKLERQSLHQQGIAQRQAESLHHHHRQCTMVQLQCENNVSQEQLQLAFFSERVEMVLGDLSEGKETSRVFSRRQTMPQGRLSPLCYPFLSQCFPFLRGGV